MPLTNTQRKLLLSENLWLKYIRLKKLNKRNNVNTVYKDRFIFGEFYRLYPKLREDETLFRPYSRMLPQTFDYILHLIEIDCSHSTTNFKKSISVEEKLLVTFKVIILILNE